MGLLYLRNTETGTFEPVRMLQGPPGLRGAKGDPFLYENFTEAQLLALKGDPGEPGASPVKGVDYFTEEEKTEMVNEVLAALPTMEGVLF